MLHLLLALGASTTPVSAEAAPVRCVPDKVTRCHQSARPQTNYELPVGKRCNPDPTKAVGCRERLRASDVPR